MTPSLQCPHNDFWVNDCGCYCCTACDTCGERFFDSHTCSIHQTKVHPEIYVSNKEFIEMITNELPKSLGFPGYKPRPPKPVIAAYNEMVEA